MNPTLEVTTGVLASDYLAELTDKKSIGRVYRTPKTKEQAIFNWMLVLKQAKPFIDGFKAEELLENDARRAEFLRRLANVGTQPAHNRSVERKTMQFESPPDSPRHSSAAITPDGMSRSFTSQHLRRNSSGSEVVSRESRPITPLNAILYPNSPLVQTSPAPSPFLMQPSQPARSPFPKVIDHPPLQTKPENPRAPPAQSAYEKPVSETVQASLLEWIESLDMVKKGALTPILLVSLSRTGVLLCDLINRLEGRREALKGVQRNPKNNTVALANVNKALEFLKAFPKMDSRYLWAGTNVVEGNENVIWGLLEDIRLLYTGKPKEAPKSPVVLENKPPPPQFQPFRPFTALSNSTKTNDLSLPPSFLQAKSNSLRSYAGSSRSRSPIPSAPSVRTSLRSKETAEVPVIQVTKEMTLMVEEWLCALNFDYLLGFETATGIEDPFKNGVLLCELVSLLEKVGFRYQAAPRTTREVRDNYEKALEVLREKRPGVPYGLLLAGEKLASGDLSLMWALLWNLMNAYPNAGANLSSDLPYGAVATKRLEASVLQWLHSCQILNRVPTGLPEVMPQIKNGTLLCSLVNNLVPRALLEYIEKPRSELSCQQNLHKALEVLQRVPRMSQKWTWKEKELLKGDSAVTLGLLEDLHRLADGLPARKRGPAYHTDGPYFGQDADKPVEDMHAYGTPSWKCSQIDSPLSFRANPESPHFKSNRAGGLAAVTSESPRYERGIADTIEAHELTDWVMSLGVTQGPLYLQGDTVEGFNDGLLLCKILESVTRTPISGLNLHPRTKAQCLQNTRKGLQLLLQFPHFPRELLSIEQELIKGNGTAARALLKEIQYLSNSSPAKSRGAQRRVEDSR